MSKTAYHFFMAQAGYSYDPKTETPMQGRIRCAKSLAYNEQRARNAGASFDWSVDPDITSADWVEAHQDGASDPWQTWQCVARDAQGKVFASLHGIDFGRDGDPWSNPYRRVVEAELACELPMDEE